MPSIEHFALFADDLETLKNFYITHFSMKVIVDNSSALPAGYFLSDDQGSVLEIIERPNGQAGGGQRYICHLAFWVEDYEKTRAALDAAGVAFEAETAVHNDAVRTEFFADPEGNRIQIVWRAKPLGT